MIKPSGLPPVFWKEKRLIDKKHEVIIIVSKSDGREQSVIRIRKCCMREWLIRRLFGDAREIFVLMKLNTGVLFAFMVLYQSRTVSLYGSLL